MAKKPEEFVCSHCGERQPYVVAYDGDMPKGWYRLEDVDCWYVLCSAACVAAVVVGDSHYIPERDGRRCVEHPTADHELVCLKCLESNSDASTPPAAGEPTS